MNDVDIRKYAINHHKIIYYLLYESFNISQVLAKKYGPNARETFDGILALKELLNSKVVPKELRVGISAAVENYGTSVKVYEEAKAKGSNNLIRAIGKLRASQEPSESKRILESLRVDKTLSDDHRAAVQFALALLETGQKTIYDYKYLQQNFGLKDLVLGKKNYHGVVVSASDIGVQQIAPNISTGTAASVGQLLAEDAAGATIMSFAGFVGGGIATLPAGGEGAIPGAVAGYYAGAIGWSGKLAWGWLTNWYHGPTTHQGGMGGGPCHHCPGDPAGPIGEQVPVPPQ